ncbi:MAG: ABC transporter substrate-binding protein [Hydrogenophaga sp.]|nr:ABC transporter substrate-binding protein [Hydrogenophaga sp.]
MFKYHPTRRALLAAGALSLTAPRVFAQDPVRIGLIAEMSGPFAEFGRQMQGGITVYQKQFGDTVAGRKVEVIIKDVGGPNPELAKRLAQELVVREKVHVLAGFGFTPNALSVAPIATQAKVPMVVMNAAAANLTDKSPFMVRTSFDYPNTVPPIARWAAEKGSKKAYVIVADYAPGHDAEAAFLSAYKATGGEIVGSVRTPLVTLDFSLYIQRVKDAKPDLLFAFVNGGDVAPAFIREYREKGLEQAGIQLVGTGDILDEAIIETIGDRSLGLTTVYPYSMHHKSELNERFVRDFKAQRDSKARPTIMAVAAYDGMAAIYAALQKTGGKSEGETLLQALQGLQLESPRGRIAIDAKTRDIVQNQYIRRVEKVDGVLANVEFSTYPTRR